MSEMPNQFCPNCGAHVTPDDIFCPECGFQLQQIVSNQPEGDSQQTQPAETNTSQSEEPNESQYQDDEEEPLIDTTNQPQPRHKNKRIILGIIAVAVLVGAYFGLKQYYAPEAQAQRLVKTLGSNNPKKLARNMIPIDGTIKLTAADVKPMSIYMKNKSHLNTAKKALLAGQSGFGGLQIVQKGSKWLLFSAYVLQVRHDASIRLYSKRGHVKIYQDGKYLFTTARANDGKSLSQMVPGKYNFSARAKINGDNKAEVGNVVVDSDGNEHSLRFDFATVKLTIHSVLEGGTVKDTNGDRLGTIKNGTAKLKRMEVNPGNEIYVVKKFSDGTAKSVKYDPSSDEESHSADFKRIVNLNPNNLSIGGDSKDDISGAFDLASSMANGDDEGDSDFEQYFTSADNDAANWFKALGNEYYKRDDVSSIDFGGFIRSVKQIGMHKWTVNFDVTYDVEYTTDDDERIQTFNSDAVFVEKHGQSKIQSISGKWKKVYDNNANTGHSESGDSSRKY